MSAGAPILVATKAVADANLIQKLLRAEFNNDIHVSTDPDQAVQDFEKCRPAVLVLAFDSLGEAERYYLGLYRLSTLVHALPHQTVILCNKDDLRRVYELCKKEYFDDYVLFWPMAQDAMRLPMAVHQALRRIAGAASDTPTAAQFATQARRIAGLEALLDQSLSQGGAHIDAVSHSLARAETEMGLALDAVSSKLTAAPGQAGLHHEIDRLKTEQLATSMQSAVAAVQPMRQWIDEFRHTLALPMASVGELQRLSQRVRRAVLIVDDDGFQQRLLMQCCAGENLDLSCAASGTEALAMVRKHRPELVLMDVNLPDIDGIEVTRRLKSIPEFAGIPVIMITGHSDKQVVIDSMRAGAADFLVKPVDKNVVVAKVRTFLEDTACD